MKSSHFPMSGTRNYDLLRICVTVFVVSMFVSAIVLPFAASAKVEKPRAKVKGNALPVLKDPNVEKMFKPMADKKLFVVVSLNIYEPAQWAESTAFYQPSLMSKGQQKFDLVKSFLKGSGLKVLNSLPDLSAVWVEGTVAQVENAFQVSIDQYRLEGREFYAADDDPSVPVDVADAVVAVAGLEDYVVYEPLHVLGPSLQDVVTPSAETVGPPYDPYEIRSAYTYTQILASGTPDKLTGKGINVAIIDAFGNPSMTADWATFCTGTQNGGAGPWQGGALPQWPAISTFYPTGVPVSVNSNWALETALDVEWVHAIAPGAKINLVISYDNSFAKMLAAFQWTVNNNKGGVISMSFGARESYLSAAYVNAWSTASRNAARKGVTLLASSGDWGYDGGNIIHPASDPYTVAVGGTELWTTGAYPGVWNGESAWTGSGGGRSILFAKQAWQYGTNVPLDGVRDIPDVSLVADPDTGVYVYISSISPPGWYLVGGTSLSAPLWAAFMAIVNQAVGAKGSSGGIGLANPWLYRVFRSVDYLNCFHDVTAGGNGGYSAGTAYDLVTGIGTLRAWNLLTLGAKYQRLSQNITYILGAKAIAVNNAGTMYIGTYQRPPGVSWPYTGVLYELEKGSTTPRAIFNAGGGITDIAVDKNGKVYVMTHTKLYKYDPLATAPVTTLVSGLTWGWGVDVDTNLNVYYTDDAIASGTGGLYWIPAGGSPARLKAVDYPVGVCVDGSRNIYVTVGGQTMRMNAAHTTWTVWKTIGNFDIDLDARQTSYHSYFTWIDLMDDYPLPLTPTKYDENLWLDSRTGIYYVDWYWSYGATTGGGWIKYLPPEKPT